MQKKRTAAETSRENFLPDSADFLAAFTENAPIMTAVFDAETFQPVYINRAFEKTCGYSLNDIETMKEGFLKTAVHPSDLNAVLEFIEKILADSSETVYEVIFKLSANNNKLLSLKCSGKTLKRSVDGKVLQIISFLENKTNDNEQSELDRFRLGAIVESSNDAIISKDFDGKILSWNKSAERIFGFTAEEVIGQNITIVFPIERLAEEGDIMEKVRAGIAVNHYETIRTTKDGRYIPVSLTVSPIRNASGEIIGVSKIVRDISDRKDAEEAVYENQKRLTLISDSIPARIAYVDLQHRFQFVNREFLNWYGLSENEVIGKKVPDIFGEESYKILLPKIKAVLAGEEQNFERTVHYNEQGERVIRTNYIPDFDRNGNVRGYYALVQDISENKIAEYALRESEERYRVFIEQSSEGIWRFELDEPFSIELDTEKQVDLIFEKGYLAECNNAMAQQYGYANSLEMLGKRLNEFLDSANANNREYVRNFVESDYHLMNQESTELDTKGNEIYFSNNMVGIVEDGKLVRAWGTQRDITATKQAQQAYQESEEQLRQSTKIEAIGRLAGGIAHDFNNFLAVIMLHVDMLNLQLPPESPLRFRISEIKSVTNNAAEMVRQLLAFGRKTTLQPHPVVLNQVVKEFVKILRPIVGEDIEIHLNLDSELGVCFVDPNQILQVLMNLAVNARDAMPSGGGLEIKTVNRILDKNTPRHKAQPIGSYVELCVTDNGVGMEAQIQKRIFEPFFTTKESGKGTGLGLATVYGIVKQSNGFIWVESEIGKGTSFKVQFPRIDQPATVVKKETPEAILRGNETILLVEDEEKIRRAAVEVLVVLGYQVLEAKHGVEAVEIASNYNKPIHLLLTDVVMPRMNGRDLSVKIKEIHPETAILFMSGYDDEIIARHGILEEDVRFISKPFSPGTLALKVRESLEN
ncbi:MAG TPA: PAS domain S-box protein [Pyrinomonadaceae bacterium]|nr:PAS domain S-box protein [Pyrinomonadaceae bacterium]